MRSGRFTSSQINCLIPKGKRKMTQEELKEHKKMFPKSRVTTIESGFIQSGLTYIQDKYLERLIGGPVQEEGYSKAMAWGKFVEAYLFSHKLGTEYKTSSQTTRLHPTLGEYWSGSCDFELTMGPAPAIAEAKCYWKRNFALYSLCLMEGDVQKLKEEFPAEYWQIVSNAIIHDVEIGEAICFMPTEDDLEELRGLAEDPMFIDTHKLGEMWQYRFIYEEDVKRLPILSNKSKIPSLNRFIFHIPIEDKDYLTERVNLAILELEKMKENGVKK
jgi:hypothetical protein